MKEILKTLDNRKQQLSQSALCRHLANETIEPLSRLSFTPAMLFFTMGFKDILQVLQDYSDPSPMQRSVNTHCEEDSFHWEWYLKDLERISYGRNFLNLPRTAVFAAIWSDRLQAVRNVVYDAIYLARTYTSPFHRLIIIEALEATFECFNEPVFQLVYEMGLQDELEYFGQTHFHSEANHAMEKTTEDQESAAYHNYQPARYEEDIAIVIINRIFNAFEEVFTCWHQEGLRPQTV